MSRLSPFGFLFGNSLTDLIRGIRKTHDAEQRSEYIRGVITSLREEARSQRLDVKTTAILKLAYLEMLGYDMSWAGFHVIEVMASPQFQQKRIGYIAAMQSFRGDSELLMLVTNLLKMDLVSQNASTVGIALSGLATIVTPLLATDVADDIMRMLSHSRPYIRQKAILAMYKVVLQYPEILPTVLNRLADLLDAAQQDESDNDPSVVCAAVSVIGELAVRTQSINDFLELTPKLYAVFIATKHNWTLIKLLKVFKLFTQREPRLRARLLPAIRNLLTTSEATSLVYESVNAILEGNMLQDDDFTLADEVVTHTLQLLNDPDGNLQYVSLGALRKVAKINSAFLPSKPITALLQHPQPDPETSRRVLSLAKYIVNDDNLFEIVSELASQFNATDNQEHKTDLAVCISEVAAIENYAYVPDFQWYIEVMAGLSREISHTAISSRLLDIVIRVKDDTVRESLSAVCYTWLSTHIEPEHSEFSSVCWWILGEFPTSEMRNHPLSYIDMARQHHPTPALTTSLAKLVTKIDILSEEIIDPLISLMTPWSLSLDFELQERACQYLELFRLARSSPHQMHSLVKNGLASLFTEYELAPIAVGSQLRIAVPASLDLDTPIDAPITALDSDLESNSDSDTYSVKEDVPAETTYAENDFLAAEKELFNLSRPRDTPPVEEFDDMPRAGYDAPSAVKPPRAPKPEKKKVLIAADETVESDDIAPNVWSTSRPVTSDRSMFKVGFRGLDATLSEPLVADPAFEQASLEPVKVKHKKKSKKTKSSKNKSSHREHSHVE